MSNVKGNDIKVAINCLVYNHEPYLRECLEGFAMQQTDFPFVAIVHDDASTDHSADIIREYAAKYPDIIHPIYETENQWRKADGSLRKIMDTAIEATGATYIALCEGDDYWTDPHKLQKQVDFLDTHPEYSICYHVCKTLINSTGEMMIETVQSIPNESTICDLSLGNYLQTLSVVYRYTDKIDHKRDIIGPCFPGDYVLWMLLAEQGKIKRLDDVMGVYRSGVGVWSKNSEMRNRMSLLVTIVKLKMVIDMPLAKKNLQMQIDQLYSEIIHYQENEYKALSNIRSSKAYRIGRVLTFPIRCWRRLHNYIVKC